jgi:hypothetical protein
VPLIASRHMCDEVDYVDHSQNALIEKKTQFAVASTSAWGTMHSQQIAGWSSPVARQAHNLKVARSNRAPATNFKPL